MLLLFFLFIFSLTAKISIQECSFKKPIQSTRAEYFITCSATNFENFLYDFYGDTSINNHPLIEKNNQRINYYSLTISNSEFINIHAFLLPLPKSLLLKNFALRNSSVEFIEDGAFEEFTDTKEIDLSYNRLNNLTFVRTLPSGLQRLILKGNHFETVADVFQTVHFLQHLDLSDCKISSIDPNSFSSFIGNILISLRNNELKTFDVLFKDDLRLDLDVSHNKIKRLDIKSRRKRIYFKSLNASHNNIEDISDLSCEDCGYSYYRLTLDFVDLSFNNLDSIKLLNSFSGVKLNDLNLSNCNITSNFDFEILKYVRGNFDLSDNMLTSINMSSFQAALYDLDLSNSSIYDISEKAFSGFSVQFLRLRSNLITKLKNYTFQNSEVANIDLSRCLIETIESNTFFELNLTHTLNLSHNRLSHILPNTFRSLIRVKYIDLSFNVLKTLENGLFVQKPNLIILNLSNSKVKVIKPKAFAGLNRLQKLYLQNNFIEKINFRLEKELEILDLRNNSFQDLDLSFLQNSTAKIVTLSDNNIQRLLNCSSFDGKYPTEINLSNSNISFIEKNAFRGLVDLKVLNLSRNGLNTILPQRFIYLKKLQTLDLSENNVSKFSKDAFSFGNKLMDLKIIFLDTNLTTDTFVTLNSLETLDISSSVINVLEKNSFKGLINLKNLILWNIEILKITPGAFRGLSNLEEANFNVFFKNIHMIKTGTFEGLHAAKILDLSNLKLSSLEEEAFMGLRSLIKLYLDKNTLKEIVGGTFAGLVSLTTLDLSKNKLSSFDKDSFLGLVNLEELSLSHNNITKLVLGTLQNFPKLQKLDIHKNNINKLLPGIFSNLNSLSVLDLAHNNITKLKMENFLPLSSLKFLNLTGNHLIQITHLELIKSLKKLTFIGINGNKWKCENLAFMLVTFQNQSITWHSSKTKTYTHENLDGIKCYDVCKFFYCADEESHF